MPLRQMVQLQICCDWAFAECQLRVVLKQAGEVGSSSTRSETPWSSNLSRKLAAKRASPEPMAYQQQCHAVIPQWLNHLKKSVPSGEKGWISLHEAELNFNVALWQTR